MPDDAPDPLGKRALFWAPAERHDDGPRTAAECDTTGKHALFSPEARAAPARRAQPGARRGTGPAPNAAPPPGREPTFVSSPPRATRSGPAGPLGAVLTPVTVECSTCGTRSEVRPTEFVLLHLPVWLWRPGRGFTRFMTCPACRRRTWVSASWVPWAR